MAASRKWVSVQRWPSRRVSAMKACVAVTSRSNGQIVSAEEARLKMATAVRRQGVSKV